MSCSTAEIIDFTWPEGNRKNLFITNIPGRSEENVQELLYSEFSKYGLTSGIQIYQYPDQTTDKVPGFYAFVTYYSAIAAYRAKESLSNRITINGTECKIAYAKRKKENKSISNLHFTKCQELANFYLGFNGWSSTVKLLQRDEVERVGDERELLKVRYICVTRLDITGHHLNSEGMGAWEEKYFVKDPTSKAKAICKCKKLAYQRSLENAFSKVILIVLPSGKVSVEVDTTKSDLILTEKQLDDSNVLKVNELDTQPESDDDVLLINNQHDEDDIDVANLQILHELEDM